VGKTCCVHFSLTFFLPISKPVRRGGSVLVWVFFLVLVLGVVLGYISSLSCPYQAKREADRVHTVKTQSTKYSRLEKELGIGLRLGLGLVLG
jgi:hypothetical protein